MMHYLKVPHRKSLRSQYVKSNLRCVAIIVLLSLCCHQNVEYYVLGLDGDGNFSAQRKRRAETSSHYAYRSQAVLKDPPYAEKRCPERPEKASISMNKVKSWEDLKGILENIPSHSEFVLPSFQVTKTKRDNPIVLRSALQLSCISRGACIIMGDQDEGGGGFVIIQGARAKVRLQGITFLNASDTAVVVSKKAGLSKDGNPALEQIFCECHFFNNNGGEGGAIRADSRTRVHIESSVFSRNYSTLGTGNTDNSGVGGGAIHNNAESMNVWFSTFDNNSAQIGVIYTHPESTLFISQNTFLLGDDEREYESAAVYVYAQDISSFVDNGGNRGYDRNGGEDKDFSYCNGVYVNNEDECIPFGDIPSTSGNENDSSGRECIDAHGVFRSHRGTLKRCDWLAIGSRKNRNCNGKTELGRMCCEECSSMPSTSNIRGGSKDQSVPEATGNPSTHPTALPTVLPLERPSITPVLPPNEGDIKDIVFYVLGDAPYQRKEFDDDQFPKQVRDIPNDSDFVFHVGDMQRTKTSLCNITWYQHVADILRYSTSPVFITPGDNDWLDCEPYIGAKQGWGHWRNTFGFFDSHWQPHKFKLVRQPNLLENVSFLYQRVLFVVVHLVSDYFDIESERKYRHTEQLKWTKEQIAINKGFFDSIVIIGHSPPSALNRDFFSAKESGISETVSELGIPVVYIHGSGHKFVEEEQFNKLDNFLRIQIPGRTSNPVKVTIKNSNMFLFDFRDGNTTTQCCENGWPHISKLNDVILQFDSR